MNRCFNTKKLAGVILAMVMAWITAIPAYAKTEGIAVVESFKGEVIVEIRGIWRKNPEKGSAVHHGDKIVTTQNSSVNIRFHDGSALGVSSNSNVRVTQPMQRDVFAEEEFGKREIRVFVGKTTYKSGDGKHVVTRMISPTAVAALRGTVVEFGTDGIYTFLNRIEGKSDNKGNITEGHVPEITQEQAAKNPNYQMSMETWNAWQKYEQAKKSSSPDVNVLYAEVVKKICESLVKENMSLENHPDGLVRARAVDALKRSREAVQKADEALKTVKQLQQKQKEILQKIQNQPENKQFSDILIKSATQTQEAGRDLVEGWAQLADALTAAMYDSTFIQELDRTTMRDLEVAVDLAKSTEKKVEALITKAMLSNDPNMIEVSLKSLEIMASAIEANAAVTDVAAKSIESALNGDKTETQQLNQNLQKTMEIAGNISDKALQAEAVAERVATASANNDATAVQEVNSLQADANTQLKSLPLPPKTEVITPTTTTTIAKPTTAISAHTLKEGIAVIESFNGEVLVESRGLWRKNPETGEALHHGDKIVTTDKSSIKLKFHDDSVLDISSNSNVRVTQPLQKEKFAEKELEKREIRVFVGKTKYTYTSGERKHVSTRMVSPSAVAALRGTIVEFGSDGNYSRLNIIDGKSENTGNIKKGQVPDVTPDQAAQNPNYQASLETWNAWQKYEQAKAASSPNANVFFVEAVKKIAESLVNENTSLANHPDPDGLVKPRASYALKRSQEAVQKVLNVANQALTNDQMKLINDYIEYAQGQTAAMYDSGFAEERERQLDEKWEELFPAPPKAPEPKLILQPPPLQDAKKVPTVTPYGQ